jgi:N-acetylneuraminic acid mutarotase
MAQHTKQPEVLQKLFAALGNDPFVIAECLARPVLTERLITDVPAEHQTGRLEFLRTAETQMPQKVAAIETRSLPSSLAAAHRGFTFYLADPSARLNSIAKAAQVNRPYQLPVIASPSGPCTADTWTATSTTNAPTARIQHTAVWTGSEMIVWGGGDFPTGGRYDPITDTWTATSTINAPSARRRHTAIWTGTEMIVWGGDDFSGYLDTGGRYNPSTDSWTATSITNAPEVRVEHTAVWTGNEMIVWGGFNPESGETKTGGRYNPSTDSWTPTSTTNTPSGRNLHTAVWTGSDMIVWGGLADNSGGRYNPVTDSWTPTSTTNAPEMRIEHTTVWTGNEMIVWGGFNPSGGTYFNTGGKYSPATDSWTPTSTANAPSARTFHTAVWTGSEMTIWGGGVDTGGRYDPAMDGWTPTSTINAPSARTYHTAVWTGSEMIVWGGTGDSGDLNTGGRYCAPGPPARLGNISTRAFVETGDNVTIGGFIVQGTQPKRVIIRAIAPELTQYGVPDPLANPTLELHDGTGALIASNNNWGTTIIGGIITANQVQDIRNSGYAPGDELESAIIAELPAGNYTAIMRGVNNMTGVGLVEVYDLSPDTDSILGSISTRAFVQTGDNVMIGGFIVQGTQPKRVIIRAIGPELTQYGVPDPLANPTLELHDGTEALIASNNNWGTTIIGGIITANQVQDIRNSRYAPGDELESAIIADLVPGNYTAIVRGMGNTTGVALVEVYGLDR